MENHLKLDEKPIPKPFEKQNGNQLKTVGKSSKPIIIGKPVVKPNGNQWRTN